MKTFKIVHEPKDPLVECRASIGGGKSIDGYYLTYRGNPEEVLEMLKEVTTKFEDSLRK